MTANPATARRRTHRRSAITWLALCLALPPTAAAHGDLNARIVAVTEQLAAEPTNAALYLKRGDLHYQHHAWQAALQDFERAAALDPHLTIVDLQRGLTLLQANQPEAAKTALDRFLALHPEHAEALVTRARALVHLGHSLAAAADFTRAIALLPRPEYYLERAQALVAAGTDYQALRSLDEGLAQLGPLVTLQLPAIELELQQARYDAALARLAQIAATSPRQEAWLTRKGEILEQAGQHHAAHDAFAAARAALDALPSQRRKTPAMDDLATRLRAALVRLQTRLEP